MEFNLGKRIYDIGEEKHRHSILPEIEEESAEDPQQISELEVIDEDEVEEAEENQKNMEAQKDSHEEIYNEFEEKMIANSEAKVEEVYKEERKEIKDTKDRGILEFLDELIRIYKNR